jgi:hypothetical protein
MPPAGTEAGEVMAARAEKGARAVLAAMVATETTVKVSPPMAATAATAGMAVRGRTAGMVETAVRVETALTSTW